MTFKEQAIDILNKAQQDRPIMTVWLLLATSFIYSFLWLVEVIEKRGKEG